MSISYSCRVYFRLLAVPLMFCAGANSRAESAAYDGFSYENRSLLDGMNGGSGFAGPWTIDVSADSANTRRFVASGESISYTDVNGANLKTEAGSVRVKTAGTGAGALWRELGAELTGTFWISFLTKMEAQIGYGWDIQFQDASGEMQFKFMNGKLESNHWRIMSMKSPEGKQRDGLFKSTKGTTPLDPTLVILKVENAGSGASDGKITAYLNPTDLKDIELSAAESVSINNVAINPVKRFSFDKKTRAEGYIDELRFGATAGDVLPVN